MRPLKTKYDLLKRFTWVNEEDLDAFSDEYPGWNNLLWATFEQVEPLLPKADGFNSSFYLKEKFGQLVFGYLKQNSQSSNEDIQKIFRLAEFESRAICYVCGVPQSKIYSIKHLYICVCPTHFKTVLAQRSTRH